MLSRGKIFQAQLNGRGTIISIFPMMEEDTFKCVALSTEIRNLRSVFITMDITATVAAQPEGYSPSLSYLQINQMMKFMPSFQA